MVLVLTYGIQERCREEGILEKREAAQERRLAETRAQLGRAVEAGPVDVKREIRRQVKAELAERLESPRAKKSSYWGQDRKGAK